MKKNGNLGISLEDNDFVELTIGEIKVMITMYRTTSRDAALIFNAPRVVKIDRFHARHGWQSFWDNKKKASDVTDKPVRTVLETILELTSTYLSQKKFPPTAVILSSDMLVHLNHELSQKFRIAQENFTASKMINLQIVDIGKVCENFIRMGELK